MKKETEKEKAGYGEVREILRREEKEDAWGEREIERES